MEISYLKDFLMMAEYEDLFEASEHLYISQSALSRHIKSIENELNVPLFERTSRSMRLNEHGRVYKEYAKRMIHLDENAKRALGDKREYSEKELRVALLKITKGYHISKTLEYFRDRYPEYRVDALGADSMENWSRLQREECDIAFVMERREAEAEVERLCFCTDCLVAVMPRDHPLTLKKRIDIYQLAGEPLIMMDRSNYEYRLCMNLFEQEKLQPRVTATAFRAESLMGLVSSGMGIAILMGKSVAENLSDDLTLRPFEPKTEVRINLVYRRKKEYRRIEEQFLACCRERLGGLGLLRDGANGSEDV